MVVAWPNGKYFVQAQYDGGDPIEVAEQDLRADDVVVRVIFEDVVFPRRQTPDSQRSIPPLNDAVLHPSDK